MFIALAVSCILTISFAALFLLSRQYYSQIIKSQTESQNQLQNQLTTLQEQISFNTTDPVSGLLGWSLFEDRINQAIKECSRFQFILGVLYVDIDNFNLINQALGNTVGDKLLAQTAERLQSCIRQVDSISRRHKDTFVILLAQLAKQETAAIIIQRILQTMGQKFDIDGHELSVTVGIGAAFYPHDGEDMNQLLQNAESAMQQAKTRGKHLYQFYQERVHEESQRELIIYNSLSSDSFLDELSVMYQPVLDMNSQSIYCAEALITWRHPDLGDISSDELFQHADKHRKLNKISEYALREACQKFLNWHALGLEPKMICVPVLLKQLENAQFVYHISQILQDMKMQPANLMLEVRENSSPHSLDILEKSFNMLEYLGVKLAVDHFGSGSFSLRYLKALTVSYLKLDASLISDIDRNPKTQAVMKGVIAFAAELSLNIIAVGVESLEQAAYLQDLGLSLMQGNLVSEPLSEREMADKMSDM